MPPSRQCHPAGVEKDKDNRVAFQAVTTTGLRLLVQLQPEFSAGILQWRVDGE